MSYDKLLYSVYIILQKILRLYSIIDKNDDAFDVFFFLLLEKGFIFLVLLNKIKKKEKMNEISLMTKINK